MGLRCGQWRWAGLAHAVTTDLESRLGCAPREVFWASTFGLALFDVQTSVDRRHSGATEMDAYSAASLARPWRMID
jgi:hypothetical protein